MVSLVFSFSDALLSNILRLMLNVLFSYLLLSKWLQPWVLVLFDYN